MKALNQSTNHISIPTIDIFRLLKYKNTKMMIYDIPVSMVIIIACVCVDACGKEEVSEEAGSSQPQALD